MGIFSKLFNLGVKSDAEENIMDNTNLKTTPITGDRDFLMIVDEVFTITGLGTVVTGCVSEGEIHIGDTVIINDNLTSVATGIEHFKEKKEYAVAGDNIGLLLNNISSDDIHKGDTITK